MKKIIYENKKTENRFVPDEKFIIEVNFIIDLDDLGLTKQEFKTISKEMEIYNNNVSQGFYAHAKKITEKIMEARKDSYNG